MLSGRAGGGEKPVCGPETGSRAASGAANASPGARGPFAVCGRFVLARQPNRMAAWAGNLREMA